MAYKTILTYLDSSEALRERIKLAADLANREQAHLVGLAPTGVASMTAGAYFSVTTDLITEDAVAFIEREQKRPFFLFVSHAAPHFPWQGPNDAAKDVRPKKKSWQQGDRETYAAMVERMLDSALG